MHVLVTGGAGFIGSNFIRFWLARHPEDRVTNVDLLTYAGDPLTLADVERTAGSRYRFVRADIADFDAMDQCFERETPEVIVNFAAESHNSRSVVDPGVFVRTNVLGTQSLLEAARRHQVRRFHHISTCEVYGDLALGSPEVFTERSPYSPRTPYNASKAAADLIVRAYYQTYGLPVTISVSANNYGPWQYPEKIIALFTTNAIDDLPLPLYRHSANRREWIHVDDHCRAIERILQDGRVGETYNVGTGDERSIEEIADAILGILRKPSSLKTYVDDRPGHDRRYLLDHKKIQDDLGWRPEVPFEHGLPATVAWYAKQSVWWRPKREKNLDEFTWAGTTGGRRP
jgi:dTDP-glucose 4,6-dehydratase